MSSTYVSSAFGHFVPRRLFGNSLAVLFAVLLITAILCYPDSTESKEKLKEVTVKECQRQKAYLLNDYFAAMFDPALKIDDDDYFVKCVHLMKVKKLWFRSEDWGDLKYLLKEPWRLAEIVDGILKPASKKDPGIVKIPAVYLYFDGLLYANIDWMRNAAKFFRWTVHEKLQNWMETTFVDPPLSVGDARIQNLNSIVRELQDDSEKLSTKPGVEIALKICIKRLLTIGLPDPSLQLPILSLQPSPKQVPVKKHVTYWDFGS